MLDIHHFQRVDKLGPAYKLNGTTVLGTLTNSNALNVGDEIDLTINHQLTKMLGITAGASLFISGQYLKEQKATVPHLDFYYAQLDMKF